MVNTWNIRRDDEPNNIKVTVTKKKIGQTPKITTPPPDPSSAKGNKAAKKNSVNINCTYQSQVYELIGFRDKAVSTVYSLLKECLSDENPQEVNDFLETSEGLSYVSEGTRVSRLKNLGAFPMKVESIDIIAQKTSILDFLCPEPSYSGGSSSSNSDNDGHIIQHLLLIRIKRQRKL